jgi:hypothetical protein
MTTPAPVVDTTTAGTTGLLALCTALTSADPATRSRDLWASLGTLKPDAVRYLTTAASPFGTLLRPAGPDTVIAALLPPSRASVAGELFEEFRRALVNTPATLRALVLAEPDPIRGRDRRTLGAAVARRLLILGAADDELAVRAVTDALIGALTVAVHHRELVGEDQDRVLRITGRDPELPEAPELLEDPELEDSTSAPAR